MNNPDNDCNDPMKQLFSQLGECPIVDVIGVVSASGPGAAQGLGEKLWSFGFGLAAWRIGNGKLEKNELYVRRKVSDDELHALCEIINAVTVVRIRARVAQDNILRTPQALLEEYVGMDDSDSELNDCLIELQKLVTFNDDYFGEFTLDRSVNTYSANTRWNNMPVELRLWLLEGELEEAVNAAHLLWKNSAKWDQCIRDCIAKDLLPLKSENWEEEDGSSVSREQFENRMSLRSITVYPNGDFDVYYDDNDLFFGHEIVVYGNLSEGVKCANIQG